MFGIHIRSVCSITQLTESMHYASRQIFLPPGRTLDDDNLPEVIRIHEPINQFGVTYLLYWDNKLRRWPFKRMQPIITKPSGAHAIGIGIALVDVNLDGLKDLIVGAEDGRLLYYRNITTGHIFTLADPVPLTDSDGIAIDVGDTSWPTAIDLDGDNDLDLLASNRDGEIYKVLWLSPGSADGYVKGELLGALELDPVDVTPGSYLPTSLAAIDVNEDGLQDVVMATHQGSVWLLRNVGTSKKPSFSLGPLIISRTAAAYLKVLDSRNIRLHFAVPVIGDSITLAYHDVPTTSGSSISGEVMITRQTTSS